MEAETTSISVRGTMVQTPCVRVQGLTLVVTGRWLRVATIKSEDYMHGDLVPSPEPFLDALRASDLAADLFVFAQPIDEPSPRFPALKMEWDNAAAIPLETHSDWLAGLSQDSRRNVRRGAKRGLEVRLAEFDDAFVQGIKGIYDETPTRQGRHFWHYGKDAERVKQENGTYLERSKFLGAYKGDELIGFIKMVDIGKAYSIMQILSKTEHFDKRPAAALISNAVDIASREGKDYLVYCKYVYGKKENCSVTEFKRRLGFKRLDYPRYYVPLTGRGDVALKLRLHRSLQDLLPEKVTAGLLALRSRCLQARNNR